MFRSLAKLAFTVMATFLLAGDSSALTTVPLKEKAAGALTSVAPGHLAYTAQGYGTHLGKYSVVGGADFDNLGNVQNGQFTQTAADGSTLTGSYSGTYAPLPSGQIGFAVTLTFVSGTGRFVGVTGQANLVAVLDTLAPGGAFSYVNVGSLVLP